MAYSNLSPDVLGARTDDGRPRQSRTDDFDDGGFSVTLREGLEALSVQHIRSGHAFAEAELMWRCWECGEMGALDDELSGRCPSCEASRENLYYSTED